MNVKKSRRTRQKLERGIEEALTEAEKAKAHFDLAMFHDNNSREAEAIPHYEAALALGLAAETRAACLAWLASSLYKTGRLDQAMQHSEEAMAIVPDSALQRFLDGLQGRIRGRLTPAMH